MSFNKTGRSMRRWLLLLFLAPMCAQAQTAINLAWNYPIIAPAGCLTDTVFQVQSSTNLTIWTVLTNVSGTNWSSNNQSNYVYSFPITVQPGLCFYTCQASSIFWGQLSLTSNVACTPPAPVWLTNFGVTRP